MDAAFDQDRFNDIYCTCKIQWYMIAMLLVILLVIIFIVTTKVRKLRLFREHLFSNVAKIMLFISDTQSYVLVKLCKIARSIHLYKLVGKLMSECVTLKRNGIWDILDLDWKEVSMTLNVNKINLPTTDIIPFRDKFRIRWLVSRQHLLLHIMLKQGMTWFALEPNNTEEEVLPGIS